jgi:hypothetical protein
MKKILAHLSTLLVVGASVCALSATAFGDNATTTNPKPPPSPSPQPEQCEQVEQCVSDCFGVFAQCKRDALEQKGNPHDKITDLELCNNDLEVCVLTCFANDGN